MFESLYQIYFKNITIILIAKELIAMSLFAYFFIFRQRKTYYNFYWKGFLLIAIGMSVVPSKILFSMPKEWTLIGLPFLIMGFILILLGANRHQQERRKNKYEKG